MSTPSSADGKSPAPSARADLRDSWAFRLAALAILLLAAFIVARGCGSADRQVSQERAIEIAREATPFQPDKVQIRLVQRGIPPRAIWAVSLYNVNAQGAPTRVNLVRVDGRTGAIVRR